MRIAHIENSIVTNISIGDTLPDGAVDVTNMTAQIGDTYNGNQFIGKTAPIVDPTPEQIRATLIAVVQAHLDAEARTHGYDGILSLASYAASTNLPFSAEGKAGLDWRDAVWSHCYQAMVDVQTGVRPIPTAAELIGELPLMAWP